MDRLEKRILAATSCMEPPPFRIRMRTTAAALASILAFCLLPSSDASERVALVVGNDAYRHAPKLRNAVADSRLVATVLKEAGFEVIALEDAGVEAFYEGLERMKTLSGRARVGLVYFAGHGMEVEGRNYLLPVDAELSTSAQLRTQAVSLDAVLEELAATRLPAKLAILDCCRDNPLSRSWLGSRSSGGGLGELKDGDLPDATMVMFSAGPGQVALDGVGANSPFTGALAARLRQPGQSVFEAFLGTSDDVVTATGSRQEPWVKFDGAGRAFRDLVFVPGGTPRPSGVEPGASAAEMATLRERAEKAEAGIVAAQGGNAVEMARLQRELEEARAKLAEAERVKITPLTSIPSSPTPMTKTDPAPAPAFPASRGMEGSRAGEVREFGGIAMVWCPAGEFLMGSPVDEEGRGNDETQHMVTLTRGFWLAKTETTQRQWEGATGSNPSEFKGADLPVERVGWEEAQGWLGKMNERHPLPEGWKWELPTEAQWEYACRAGTETAYAGNGKLDEMGWYGDNSGGKTHAVGGKKANAWGLHDMHGNVWEWCRDWYGDYPSGAATDPAGPAKSGISVGRGGSAHYGAASCRSALRARLPPYGRVSGLGFRAAAVPPAR
mgnify:CR=1 FL=1